MTAYTPNTEYVRDFYAKFQANLELHPGYDDERYEAAEAEFDRWLASVKADIREQIEADVLSQREGYVPSPGLDPAWISGWRAATDLHAVHIARGAAS